MTENGCTGCSVQDPYGFVIMHDCPAHDTPEAHDAVEIAGRYVDIVFDGPPNEPPPRFVEAENELGHGVRVGEWLQRPDGCWVLRIAGRIPGVTS